MVPVLDTLDLLTACDPGRRKTVCQISLSILIGLNWGRAVGRQTYRDGYKHGLPKLPPMSYFFGNSEVTVSCCSGQHGEGTGEHGCRLHRKTKQAAYQWGLISDGSIRLPSQTPDAWKAFRAVYYASSKTHQKKEKGKEKKGGGGEVVIGVRSSMTRYISHLAVGSPRAPSPPATTRTPGGAERGGGGSPCPGSWWPQVARSRPPPGWARPQARTLAPQPPLLEPEDADLGENVHQVAVAEPAVLAGAVPPPAGRGPVPVLLPRLPLLADQAAGDGRCHGCSPARPRRSAPRRAGGGRRGAQPRRGPIPGGAGERAREPPPGRGAAAAGPPRPAARGSCSRRGSPHGCPAAPPALPRRRAPAPRGTERGVLGADPRCAAPGRAGGFASPGCPSAPRCHRPLARRCHRRGWGGYRRLFQAPA